MDEVGFIGVEAGEGPMNRRIGFRIALMLLAAAACLLGGLRAAPAYAASTFVSAPTRQDIAFDDARGLLYITSGDRVLRYEFASGRFLSPYVVGGDLVGIDLSADGRYLGVADAQYVAATAANGQVGTRTVHVIDVRTGRDTKVYTTFSYYGGGTLDVAWGADGKMLFSLADGGWTNVGRYDPATGVTDYPFGDVTGWVLFGTNADRTTIGFAQGDISDGRWGVYSPLTGATQFFEWYTDGTSDWNYSASLDRTGTQLAIPGSVMRIMNVAGGVKAAFGQPFGGQFSPTADVLYMPNNGTSLIGAYRTSDYSQVGTYDVGQVFNRPTSPSGYYPWPATMVWPRLAISRDNAELFCTTAGGVSLVQMRPTLRGDVRSSLQGLPVPGAIVELWRNGSTGWSLEATSVAGPGGEWSYATDNLGALRVHVYDPLGAHSSAWVGGDSLATAASVSATISPAASADATLALVAPVKLAGTVRSTWAGVPVSGVQARLYEADDSGDVVASTTTAGDGSYAFTGLCPGSYRVAFHDPSGANADDWLGGGSSFDSAIRVAVGTGTTAAATETLTYLPLKLTGVASSSSRGVPVAGAVAELWRSHAGSYSLETTRAADASGRWSFDTSDTAPVRVRLFDPRGFHDPVWIGGTDLASATDFVAARPVATSADATMSLVHPATIAGTVHRAFDATPAVGITVTLYRSMVGYPVLATTSTAADGSYSFGGLGPDAYRIGFSDASGACLSQYFDGAGSVGSANDVVITTPSSTTSADATLTFVPCMMGGTVTSTFRSLPVASAVVELWKAAPGGGYSRIETLPVDSSGAWTASLTDATLVRVRVTDPTGLHAPVWYGGADVESATDIAPVRYGAAPSVPVVMPLTAPGAVQGHVTSTDGGTALAGAQVSLYLGGGSQAIAATLTAADGSYRFDGLDAATYEVGFVDPTGANQSAFFSAASSLAGASPIAISAPGAITADQALSFIRLTAKGTVTSSYRSWPVADATLEVWRSSGGVWSRTATFSAGDDGTWTYSTDTTAPVRLRAVDPNGANDAAWFGGGTNAASAQDVVPTRGTPAEADITLPFTHPGSITGTVSSSVGAAPIAGAIVQVFAADDMGMPIATAVTATDGSYAVPGLGPSLYEVEATDPSGTNADSDLLPVLLIAGGSSVTQDVTLEFVPLTLQGCVYSGYHHMPLPTATAEIWRQSAGSWSREATVATDPDGYWAYSTDSTAPARVRLIDPAGMDAPTWYGQAATVTAARDATPTRDDFTSFDTVLPLQHSASVTGTVTDWYFRTPAAGIQVVFVADEDGEPQVASTITAADGSYGIDGLGPGGYLVFFHDPAKKYVDQWFDYEGAESEADSVQVSAPTTYGASAQIDRVSLQLLGKLTTPTPSPDATTSPHLGESVVLDTTLTDSLWQFPIYAETVVLQSSVDGSRWSTVTAADALVDEPDWVGDYEASFLAANTTPTYYRFAVPGSSSLEPTTSVPVLVAPRANTTSWVASLDGVSATSWSGTAGTRVSVRGRLLDYSGQPFSATSVWVEESYDGVSWMRGGSDIAGFKILGGGSYQATITAGNALYYRFACGQSGYNSGSASAPLKLVTQWRFGRPGAVVVHRVVTFGCGLSTPARIPSARIAFVFQRRSGSKWVGTKTIWVPASKGVVRGASAKVKLAKGKYRVWARGLAGPDHMAGSSPLKEFLVK